MFSNILDKVSFWIFYAVVILLPVFCLPFSHVNVDSSKSMLLVVGLVISLIFWVAARFSDGKIVLPKSKLLIAGFLIAIVTLLSALFSSSVKMSMFGIAFDPGTFWFIFSLVVVMFFSSVLFREYKQAKMVLTGLLVSASTLFVFQAFRFLMPSNLSLGILQQNTDNVLGSWNSFGLFAGLIAFLGLYSIEFLKPAKRWVFIHYALLTLSVLMVAIVNFTLVWKILGVFALFVFVYKISYTAHRRDEHRNNLFPVASFLVVVVSLLFFLSPQFVGQSLSQKLDIKYVEINPTFQSTLSVTGDAMALDPVFGAGPNRFGDLWALYKPESINYAALAGTEFWDRTFSQGNGLFLTFASTNGIAGIVAWLIFLILFVGLGVKVFSRSVRDRDDSEIVLFFLIALFLVLSSMFYSSSPILLILAFVFIGISIGLYYSDKERGEMEWYFLDDPRKRLVSALLLVLIMIVSAGLSFKYIEKFASISSFGKTLSAQNVDEAEMHIRKALSLHQNDLYYRTYSQVYLLKLNSLVEKADSLTEAEKAQVQPFFDEALAGATLAIKYNPDNYLNHQILGSVYQLAVVIGEQGAYEGAIMAYTEASKRNPLHPGIKLAMSRTALVYGDRNTAREYAKESLVLKNNYVDALIVLSQIEKISGNQTEAVSYAEQALGLYPNDTNLINYVDSIRGGLVPDELPIVEENKEGDDIASGSVLTDENE